MLRWKRCIILTFISGAAFAAPEINVKQNESLPDLGSQAAQQDEQTNKGKSLKERGADYIINSATQGFENLTPEALESQARSYLQSQITSTAQSYIEDTLSPYGKVRSNLSIGQGGDLDGSSIDYFVPWYDNQTTVYFSQFSAERKEDRTIGNIGLGVRHNFNEWLLGGNIFYDYDFTRGHRRLGLGGEAWTDYLKFSGNYYHPLSDWKDSEDFDFYEERPARGWDIRAEAWLPSYPQLGGKVVFEQYYGDEVALFGTDNLEKDPYAVTLGLNYQPVPLLTVGADYKAGTGDNSDVSINATLNYQFGVPLKDQLDSDKVKAAHSLMGSRHDFVERNNFIVLEYKEKDPLDVTLWLKADATNEHPECVIKDTPEAAVGLEKCKWTINALINHHYKIVAASWQAKNNAARTLVMPVIKENTLTEGNNNHWNLVLPAWQYSSDKAEQEKLNTWRVRLALAGYCVAPVALAEESAWVDSGETNIFQGTIPWLYSEGGSATTDADHVTLTSDLKGARPTGSETDKRLYSGDKLTVSWEIGDTEGDVDLGGLGDNAKTIDTIRWMSYKDAQGGDPKELATKVTSYTLTDDDRGRYIGIEITPTTQTGTPNVGTALHLYDISTASGGGSDSDNVAPGPVVN